MIIHGFSSYFSYWKTRINKITPFSMFTIHLISSLIKEIFVEKIDELL